MTPNWMIEGGLAMLVVWPLLWGAWTLVLPVRLAAMMGVVGSVCLGTWVWTLAPQTLALGGWAPPLGLGWRLDAVSQALIALVAWVGAWVSLYAWWDHALSPRFWGLWLGAWAAMNALLMTADVFHLYVTLELLGVAAVAMVALTPGWAGANAAFRYLLVSLSGSMLFLLGVALLYGRYGVLDMVALAQAMQLDGASALALALMTVGLMAKTAVLPLHAWLPHAHAQAQTAVSALLSALVVKAGLYALARLWLEVFAPITTGPNNQAWWLWAVVGSVAIFWGGYQALRASHLKALVAWSTVAQIGGLVLALGLMLQASGSLSKTAMTALWWAWVWLVAAHALAKAAWFLAAGTVKKRAGTPELAQMALALQHSPVSVFAFALGLVSLAGLPLSMGFLGKWWWLALAWEHQAWWFMGVSLLGSLLTLAYGWRILNLAVSGKQGAKQGPKALLPPPSLQTVPVRLDAVALVLAALSVFGALGSHWFWEMG